MEHFFRPNILLRIGIATFLYSKILGRSYSYATQLEALCFRALDRRLHYHFRENKALEQFLSSWNNRMILNLNLLEAPYPGGTMTENT